MKLLTQCLFHSLLGAAGRASAYILDGSCIGSQPRDFEDIMTTGMANAFDLASAAQDTLGALAGGSANQAQQDLMDYLFFEAKKNGAIDTTWPLWYQVNNVYSTIAGWSTKSTDKSNMGSNDVIFYCDFSRFTEGKSCDGTADKNVACDTDTQIDHVMDSDYTGCKNSVNFDTTEAWTVNNAAEGKIAQVQMCKWFLQYSFGSKRKYWKDTGPKAALARPIGKVMGILGARTPMDAAELLESTLLHEMTHAVKSNTQSVGTTSPNSVSTCNDNGGKSATYGWENCVALSPFGPKPNPRGGSTTNADSYAIFGLASRMISPNSGLPAQRPMLDGSIQVLPDSSSSKRGLDDWQGAPERLVYPRQQSSSSSPNVTVTLDNTNVTLGVANATGFVVSPSLSTFQTVTVQPGSLYTIGSDTVSLESSGVIIDSTTIMFPVTTDSSSKPVSSTISSTSTQNTNTTTPATTSEETSSTSGSISTSAISGSANSSTSSITTSQSGSTGGPTTNTTTAAQTTTTSNDVSSTTGSDSSSSSSTSGSVNTTSTTGGITGPSGSSVSSSSTGSANNTSSVGPTTGTSGTGTTSSGATSSSPSVTFNSETITSSSSTTVVPITVITATSSGSTTQITYKSTSTSSGTIGPTPAWVCQGPLCDQGSSCIVPIFCPSGSDSTSWGLCCGWGPVPPPGSSGPPPGGPSPGPPGSDTNPTSAQTSNPSSSGSSTGSSTGSSSESSSSSSCTSTATASSCEVTIAVTTPSGATTASTTTITGTCSTVSGCSVTNTASTTTSSSNSSVMTASAFVDFNNNWDGDDSWFSAQASALDELNSDTDPFITWSPSENENSTESSTSGSTTTTATGPSSTDATSTTSISSTSSSSSATPPSTSTVSSTDTSSSIPTSSASSTSSAVSTCSGNQIDGSCTQASLPSATPDSGAVMPVCYKTDTSQDPSLMFNDTKAAQGAADYCSQLISAGVVLSSSTSSPAAGHVDNAAENGGFIALTVLFDAAYCDPGTSSEDQKLDFKAFGQDQCEQYLYQELAQFCAKDSTWGDYNPDYSLEGGVYGANCALWSMEGLPSS